MSVVTGPCDILQVKRLEDALAVAHTTAQDATVMFDCLEEDKQILSRQLQEKASAVVHTNGVCST